MFLVFHMFSFEAPIGQLYAVAQWLAVWYEYVRFSMLERSKHIEGIHCVSVDTREHQNMNTF